MSPAASALEAPSHLRVRFFTNTKGSAPIPVATAVSNAKRKTWAADVEGTPLTLVAPAHSFSRCHDNRYLPASSVRFRRRAGRSNHMSARSCIAQAAPGRTAPPRPVASPMALLRTHRSHGLRSQSYLYSPTVDDLLRVPDHTVLSLG